MTAQKRTISLPSDQADYVDGLVEAGVFASASEVFRAGLRALQEREAAVERWLRAEVVPVAVAMLDDPDRALTADQVFDDLRRIHRSPGRHGAPD